MITAKNVMTSPVFSIPPESTVEEAVALMLKRHISGLPVVDADDCLVGVVTEYDMLRLIYDLETCHEPVSNYMTRDLHTVTENATLIDVADVFLEHPIRRLLVVDGRKLMGVISRRDLIQFIHDFRSRLAGRLPTMGAAAGSVPAPPARREQVAG